MNQTNATYTKTSKVAAFFNAYWDAYVKNPTRPIKAEHFKAVNAMRACRTAIVGIEIYLCVGCDILCEVCHSCKHRFCPICSWKDTMKWAEKAYNRLLNIPHRHAVATIPHQLNRLFENNYKLLNNALLKASSETVKDWFNAKFSIVPGIMSVLHTFGEKKNQHNHSHMIVSMGGINRKTGEFKTVALDYIPYDFLSKKFRIKFEDILVELFDTGELKHNFKDRIELMQLLKNINKKNWRFHFEPPMEDPLKVIKYIGRYSKRACISERKITEIDGEYISFTYKDNLDRDNNNKPREKTLKLHYSEFYPLLLQHVPPSGYQIIRYYGLYANSSKVEEKYTTKPPMEKEACTAYKDPKICECCGKDKIHVTTIFEKRKDKKIQKKYDLSWPKSVLKEVLKSFDC